MGNKVYIKHRKVFFKTKHQHIKVYTAYNEYEDQEGIQGFEG